MIKKRKTRIVTVGSVKLGSDNPVVIQSMTKVPTTDVNKCLNQVRQLARAGCGLVRIAVPTAADTKALARIIGRSPVPVIADIHFSPARAIEAIQAGAAKIRLNPGNIKKTSDINTIIDCAKAHRIAVRIGVNEASIRNLKDDDISTGKRVKLMVNEMKKYVRIFEKRKFTNIVLSAKSADTIRTIEVNRAISQNFDYPIHIGLTHAGLCEDAQTPSAVALGTLLAEGIGDTMRVSFAGDPVKEAVFAKQILGSLGMNQTPSARLIVCPTCGRCKVDLIRLAKRVRKVVLKTDKPLRIAVMGCVVNGPGEAADADIALCAAQGKGFIYLYGKKIKSVPEQQIPKALAELIDSI